MKPLLFALPALLMTQFAAAQSSIQWDLPTGYAANTFQTQNLMQFASEVETATGGKLKITLHPGGSLFKQTEIKRAIQGGLAPAGEFIISGLANENPLFGVDSIPFLATTYPQAHRLYDVARPYQQKLLAAQGVKLLFSVPWPGQSLYSVKPIENPADFKGSKMRAYNPATTRIAQLLGAQPTTIQLPELGQALATGTVTNFLTSSASGVDGKLYEQTKYFYPVSAWLPRNVTAVSEKAFAAIDKPLQEAVLKAAAAAEQRGWQVSEQKNGEYVKELAAHGMKVAPPSAAVSAELRSIGEQMTEEWIATAGADGRAIVDAYRKP